MLYYDEETETFWEQMSGRAVIGPLTGQKLKWLPCEITTWGEWKKKHPKTTVLKPAFNERRYEMTEKRYTRYRAGGKYWNIFKIDVDPAYKQMEQVAIVSLGDTYRCFPYPELKDGENKDGDLVITKKGASVIVTGKDGRQVPHMTGYWFAWCAYYKDGTVYKSAKPKSDAG